MDIFEELNKKLQAYEVENFKSWLHVLTRNHCLMKLRSPKHFKSTELKTVHLQGEETGAEESFLEKKNAMKPVHP